MSGAPTSYPSTHCYLYSFYLLYRSKKILYLLSLTTVNPAEPSNCAPWAMTSKEYNAYKTKKRRCKTILLEVSFINRDITYRFLTNMMNSFQPIRPRIHPTTGQVLAYATMPNLKRQRLPSICDLPSMMTQCRLYRAVRQGYVEKQVAISDLYEYCFYEKEDIVSKTQMGYIAVASVTYEPRLLVNNSIVGKPTMTYTFRHLDDFRYGLEWMICVWLRKFLNDNAPPEEAINSADEMATELDLLGNSDLMEYVDVYESKFENFVMLEPDWRSICANLKEDIPDEPKENRPPPKEPRKFEGGKLR